MSSTVLTSIKQLINKDNITMINQYKITSQQYSVSYLLKPTDTLAKLANMAQSLNNGDVIKVLKNGYPFIVLTKNNEGVKIKLNK